MNQSQAQSKTYRVVSVRWVRLMTLLNIVGLMGGMLLAYWVYKNQQLIHDGQDANALMKERVRATAELTSKRSVTQVFSYNKACEFAKSKGQACLPETQWWADPKNYPLLRDSEFGVGLFPPKEGEDAGR